MAWHTNKKMTPEILLKYNQTLTNEISPRYMRSSDDKYILVLLWGQQYREIEKYEVIKELTRRLHMNMK